LPDFGYRLAADADAMAADPLRNAALR